MTEGKNQLPKVVFCPLASKPSPHNIKYIQQLQYQLIIIIIIIADQEFDQNEEKYGCQLYRLKLKTSP